MAAALTGVDVCVSEGLPAVTQLNFSQCEPSCVGGVLALACAASSLSEGYGDGVTHVTNVMLM